MYNTHHIMTRAWEITRSANVAKFCLRVILRNALRTAWREAKDAVQEAKWAARAVLPTTEVDSIREAIVALECKPFGISISVRMSEHRAELARAVEAEEPRDFATMSGLIAEARGRFCSVVYIKKDGTPRTMRVQPASLKFYSRAMTPPQAPAGPL